MIGKTNSIVVKGGDTPTPATTDRYKGLRPSYWPTIKMPDELENGEVCEMLIELNFSHTNDIYFDSTAIFGNSFSPTKIDWGNGTIMNGGSFDTAFHYNWNDSFTLRQDEGRKAYAVFKLFATNVAWNLNSYSKTNPNSLTIREISHNKGGVLYESVSTAELSGCMFYSVYNDSTNYNAQWRINGGSIIHWPYFKIKDFGWTYAFKIYSPLKVFPTIQSDNYNNMIIYNVAGQFPSAPEYVYDSASSEDYLRYGDTEKNNYTSFNTQVLPYKKLSNWGTELGEFNFPERNSVKDWSLVQMSVYDYSMQQQYYKSEIVATPYFVVLNNGEWNQKFYGWSSLQYAAFDFRQITTDGWVGNVCYQCDKLKFINMPPNSLKVSIDLSSIKEWYTDTERYTPLLEDGSYDTYNPIEGQAGEIYWKAMIKALYDFTAAGETPSYTPTLTVSTTIYNELPNHTDDNGNDLLTAITNKGWTVAQA